MSEGNESVSAQSVWNSQQAPISSEEALRQAIAAGSVDLPGGRVVKTYQPNAALTGANWVPGSGDTPGSWNYTNNIDYSKLPKLGAGIQGIKQENIDKLNLVGIGDYANTPEGKLAALKTQKYVTDPRYVYYDKDYGWVTPKGNLPVKERFDPLSLGPAIVLGAATMGAGAALNPMITGSIGAMQGMANGGDWKQALIGAGLGMAGSYAGGALSDAVGGGFGGDLLSKITNQGVKTLGGQLVFPSSNMVSKGTSNGSTTGKLTYPTGGTNMSTGSEQYPIDPMGSGNIGDPIQVSSVGSRGITPMDSYEGLVGGYAPTASGSGGSPMDWFSGILNGANSNGDLAQRLGMLGSAYNSYNNASMYDKLYNSYKQDMNPFGDQRAQYAKQLSDSYTNPAAFLNDPGHQAVVNKQMNVIQGRNRAMGNMQSGRDATDLADYQAQADAQFLNQERQQLGQLAGSQISPAYAADLLKTGTQGAVTQRGNALAAAAAALSPKGSPGTSGNSTGPVQGALGAAAGMLVTPANAAQVSSWVQQGLGTVAGGKFLANGHGSNSVMAGNSPIPGSASGDATTPFQAPGTGISDPYADNPLFSTGGGAPDINSLVDGLNSGSINIDNLTQTDWSNLFNSGFLDP